MGYSFDNNREDWLNAVKTLGMTWIQLSVLQGWQSKAGRLYGINAIPDNILINPDGIIVARNLRGAQLVEELSKVFKPSKNNVLSRKINDILNNGQK